MPSKIDKKTFLEKLRQAHGGKIIRLKNPAYTKSDTSHTVRCTECGHVWAASGYTLTSKNPNGCPKCALKIKSGKLTTPENIFIKQLKSVHGTSIRLLDGYTKVGDKANFICNVCKHTWSTKCISLIKTNPHGCPSCATLQQGIIHTKTQAEFELEMEIYHGNKIKVLGTYTKSKSPIKVQCTACNHIWNPTPDNLTAVNPHGCPKCKAYTLGLKNSKTRDQFVKQLKLSHKGTIKLVGGYKKQTSELEFQCNKGHKWSTNQTYALIAKNPSGCPYCSKAISKGEKELFNWIKRYLPEAQPSKRLVTHPETGGKLQWDIYIPSKNIAVEYNGVYFHSYPRKTKHYHAIKSKCSLEQHGVRVIHITDVEWKTNSKVVKKTLKHLLGLSKERYYARKLVLHTTQKLTSSIRSFYEKNHLQGSPRKGISYVLTEGKSIKAVMTFCAVQSVRGTRHDTGTYELIRYASKGSVVGGASKLFTAFLRHYNPKVVLSYSQNDWFNGGLYTTLGFTKVKDCGADYRTVWEGRLRHKSYTRRTRLEKLLGENFDPSLTERQNLINNGIPIIYDSGKIKWKWNTQ